MNRWCDMADPIAEALNIIRRMRGTIRAVRDGLSPPEGAKDHGKFLHAMLDELQKRLRTVRKGSRIGPEKLGSAATIHRRPEVKPCWADANAVFEWATKSLPPGRHGYRDILDAARGAQASRNRTAPRVRLPASAATFGQYVRAYRRACKQPLPRALRRRSAGT